MIRLLSTDHRAQLVDLIERIDNFTHEEKLTAVELIDEALLGNPGCAYIVYVFEESEKVLGYYCIGKRYLTDGVYDLYWIVVDSNNQKGGVGSSLLEHAENFVKENKGRWILAETSSKDSYRATRNFYLRNKYSIVSQIKDFYKIKDDLIVFGKYFNTN
jgi:aminoglycoside 6'-N-acetyltransferase I